jgi:putative endonuclease
LSVRKKTCGGEGEKKAENYLKSRGYDILGKNQRVAGVEIDLIACKDNFLCLVEVKTRSSNAYGFPEEFVDYKKQRRLIRGGKMLLNRKAYQNLQIRFDIVSVLFKDKKAEINHIKNAFEE